MNKQIIGENAGILWRLMNQESHRQWQLEELKPVSYTHLTLPTNSRV